MLAPFALLVPLAWAASRPFDAAASNGMLALGVSSTEVAAVGMVALAGGLAALAVGALTGSLVVAALAGPPLLELSPGPAEMRRSASASAASRWWSSVPLVGGLADRAAVPRLGGAEEKLAGLASITLVALVYGAMSAPVPTAICSLRQRPAPSSWSCLQSRSPPAWRSPRPTSA